MAAKGNSPKDQTDRIKAFCSAKDLDLVEVLVDPGECSKSLDRPGIQECLRRLRAGEARGLVVAHLDRLTRHVGDVVSLVETLFIHREGPRLFSVSENVDPYTAGGRMFIYFIILMSQYQREIGVEKTVGAMAKKRDRSERRGNIPFGYRTDGSDGRRSKAGKPTALVPSEIDLAVKEMILSCRAGGLSLQGIADQLNQRGIPSKRGVTRRSTGLWSKSSIRDILKREAS